MSDGGHGERAFVSGGSGFVGSAVIRRLQAEGFHVRALMREGSPRAGFDPAGVEIVTGDLRDAGAVRAAMQGATCAFHVAADYRLWVPDPATMIAINVEGTRHVMQAALAAGVRRIVHTSSVATLALSHSGGLSDESRPVAEADAIGLYKKTKLQAERLVEAMVAEKGLPAVIVNPSTPVGPCDVKPTPTGRIIIEAASGRMPAYVETGLNLVHVDDVAAGHLAALRHGRIGERYVLGGENVSLRDMLGAIATIVGRPAPRIALPRRLIYPLALAAEAFAGLTGRTPFVTRDGLRMARHRMFFSSAKAERELGYRARPHAEGLADAVAWFRGAGMLR